VAYLLRAQAGTHGVTADGLRGQKDFLALRRTEPFMKPLRVGDWVRTACGDEGQVDLLSRLSAFIEFWGQPHSGQPSCLQSELTKIDRPKEFIFPTLVGSSATSGCITTQVTSTSQRYLNN